MTTPAPAPQYDFNCSAVNAMPGGGKEILVVACILIVLIISYNVSWIDLIIKQWMPSFLDPNVSARIAQIQQLFPNLGLSPEQKALLYTKEGEAAGIRSHYAVVERHGEEAEEDSVVMYDEVLSQSAYIASKTCDDDLTISLVNDKNYKTISDSCSSLVRNYAQLSPMFPCMATCLMFLCLHEQHIDNRVRAIALWPQLSLFAYGLGVLTSIVMDQQPGSSVYRDTNIALCCSIPYTIDGKSNGIEKLHSFGVVMFALLPTIAHAVIALTLGEDKMLGYKLQLTIIVVTLVFAAVFGLADKIAAMLRLNPQTGNKISILAELLTIFTAVVGFLLFEAGPAMYCTGNYETWQAIVGATLAPFLFAARTQCWAPAEFPLPPSLLLMYKGNPTATFGPESAVEFNSQLPLSSAASASASASASFVASLPAALRRDGSLPRVSAAAWMKKAN